MMIDESTRKAGSGCTGVGEISVVHNENNKNQQQLEGRGHGWGATKEPMHIIILSKGKQEPTRKGSERRGKSQGGKETRTETGEENKGRGEGGRRPERGKAMEQRKLG